MIINFCFKPDARSLDQFGTKTENSLFKFKFGAKSNMNVHNQFFLFKLKVQRLGKFGTKIQNCLIKLKFGFNPANISVLSQRCSLVDTTSRHRTTSNQR